MEVISQNYLPAFPGYIIPHSR